MQTTTSRHLHLTYCNKAATTQVKHISFSWNALSVKLTSKPVVTADRESLIWPLFVPFKMTKAEDGARMSESAYGEFYHRGKANVEHMDLLVIDIDNDPKHSVTRPYLSFEDAKTAFANLACVFYTSYNHKNTLKHNVDKYRVVLPLLDAVTLEDVEQRKQALADLFPYADPASFTASQPFYLPIAHPDREALHASWEGNGEWFDLLALEATVKPLPVKSTSTYVQTGDTVNDLPAITLKNGHIYRADELYDFLQEGYDHRVQCYRIGGGDKSAGCYIYRKGSGLLYKDNTASKSEFIRVMKTVKLQGPDEEEVVTTPMWVRKAKAVAAPKVARAPVKSNEPLVAYDPSTIEIIHLNDRYLPSDLHERIAKEGITVIRSPKGTGKTEVLKHVAARAASDGESVMLLGHRVYLLQNLAVRTNLDYYRDLEDGQTTSSMALCMNSLTRIDPAIDAPYDTIIIDESEQVFQALTSPLLQSDLGVIFNNLIWLFRRAKRIICLDADLSSELSIELIREMRGTKESDNVTGVINDYKIGTGQTTQIYEKRFHLLADALDAVADGEKVFISCNSKRFATIVDAIVKDMGKTSLLLTSETNELPEQKAFISQPTTESLKYDVVVSSPTLSTGVSIEGNHFTKVFGFFGLNPGTYQDADQAISRVRHCASVAVWIQGNLKTPMIESEEDIYIDLIRTEQGTRKRLYNEEDAYLTQGELLWGRIAATIKHKVKLWSVHKDKQFSDLRTSLGFTVESVKGDDEKTSTGSMIYRSYKDVGVDRALAVFNAAVIEQYDDERALELGRKKQRTAEEQLSLERFRLFKYLKDDFTIDTVRKALKQELLKSLASIRTLHIATDSLREHDDKADRKKNKSAFTANKHRVIRHELIEGLCNVGKINLDTIYNDVRAGKLVEIGLDTLTLIAKEYETHKRDFNFYFGAKIKEPTDQRNVKKVWDLTFGEQLSLPLIAKKQGPRDKRVIHYYIDSSKKDLVIQAMTKLTF